MMRQFVRIAYVVRSFHFGGLERVVAHLANHLDRARFQPMVICLNECGGAVNWVRRGDVPVVELKAAPGNNLGTVKRLAKEFRDHQLDLVHSHNWGTLVETVLACRRSDTPHVHAEHGLALDEYRVRGWKRQLRRLAMGWAMRRVEAVVAIAQTVQRWIERDCHVPRGKVRYIPNGVETPPEASQETSRVRRALGLDQDAFVFGSVGRLVGLKDFGTAIRATAALRKQGRDVHLVLVGDGPEREHLQQEAQAAAVEGRVHLVGYHADPGSWLRVFDAYVNCSRTEAMNMGILEAMAAGLPVVATAVGDSPLLVAGDKPAGILVPAADETALARAMAELTLSPRLLRDMAENGRQRYCSEYSVTTMVARYSSLYAELVG